MKTCSCGTTLGDPRSKQCRACRWETWYTAHPVKWKKPPRGGTVGRPRNTVERIMRNHRRIMPNGCWEWTGGLNRGGYGKTRVGFRHVIVSRYVYEEMVAPVPVGMFVCHRCDNPKCMNPDHLFVGTQTDNVRDSIRKGRWHTKETRNKPMGKPMKDLLKRLYRYGLSVPKIAHELAINDWTVRESVMGKPVSIAVKGESEE